MIQPQTRLVVADNTGAKSIMCIRVLGGGGGNPKYAGVGDVIRTWAPLGYNQRAVRLHRLAQNVVAEHAGALPQGPDQLRRMTGIGEYTLAAVRCFAFGQDVPVIDTNVRRVLGRYFLGTASPPPKYIGLQAIPRSLQIECVVVAWGWLGRIVA